MSSERPVIYLVDDKTALSTYRSALYGLCCDVRGFTTARAFVNAYAPAPVECIVCALHLPDMAGLHVLHELAGHAVLPPLIFVANDFDVATVVEAVKAGAFDCIEAPVDGPLLVQKVEDALTQSRKRHRQRLSASTTRMRFERLTPKEHLVARHIARGKTSRETAAELGLSTRTVEGHRARLMGKLEIRTAVELASLLAG